MSLLRKMTFTLIIFQIREWTSVLKETAVVLWNIDCDFYQLAPISVDGDNFYVLGCVVEYADR